MKYMLLVAGAIAVLCAFGATIANALPDLAISLGGSYPLGMLATNTTVKTALSSSAGSRLTGTGILFQPSAPELGPLGTYDILFTKVKNAEGVECSTEGDKSGELLLKGQYGVVYRILSPLTLGLLFLLEEVKLTCGTEKIKMKGDFLASLTAAEGEITEVRGEIMGNGKGVPSFKGYFNDEGKEVATKLETNFGTGFVATALEVAEAIKPVAQGGKMFEITGR